MKSVIKSIALIATLTVATSASAFWGNGYNSNNGSGDATGAGEGSFGFNMSAKGSSRVQGHIIYRKKNAIFYFIDL